MLTRLLPWLPFALLTYVSAAAAPQKVDRDALTLLTACSNAVQIYTFRHFANPNVRTCQDPKLKLKENGAFIDPNSTDLNTRLNTEIKFFEGVGPSDISVRSASGQWLTRVYRDTGPWSNVPYIVQGKEANIAKNAADAEVIELLLSCETAYQKFFGATYSTEQLFNIKTCNDPRLTLKNEAGYGSKIIGPTKLSTEIQAKRTDNAINYVINIQSRSGTWFSLSQRSGDIFVRQPSIVLEGKAKL